MAQTWRGDHEGRVWRTAHPDLRKILGLNFERVDQRDLSGSSWESSLLFSASVAAPLKPLRRPSLSTVHRVVGADG